MFYKNVSQWKDCVQSCVKESEEQAVLIVNLLKHLISNDQEIISSDKLNRIKMALAENQSLCDHGFPTELIQLLTELKDVTVTSSSRPAIDPYSAYGEIGFQMLGAVATNAVIPVASCLGIMTNVLNLIALRAERIRSSRNVTLDINDLSDILLASFSCIMFINYITLGHNLFIRPTFWGGIKVLGFATRILVQTSRTVTTTTQFSVHSFSSVRFVSQARHFMTPSRLFHVNLAMWIFRFLILSPHDLYPATIAHTEDNSVAVSYMSESTDSLHLVTITYTDDNSVAVSYISESTDSLYLATITYTEYMYVRVPCISLSTDHSNNLNVDSPNTKNSDSFRRFKSNVQLIYDFLNGEASQKLPFLMAESYPNSFFKYFLTPFRCLMLAKEVGKIFALRKQRNFRKKMQSASHDMGNFFTQLENGNAELAIGNGIMGIFTNSNIEMYIYFSTTCSIEILCAYYSETVFYFRAQYIIWSAGVINCYSSLFLLVSRRHQMCFQFVPLHWSARASSNVFPVCFFPCH